MAKTRKKARTRRSSGENRKKLLVIGTTFPRWKNDSTPPFVFELSKRMTGAFDVHVLAPEAAGAKKEERWEGMSIHRFHFWPGKRRVTDHAIMPTLRKKPWMIMQVPFIFLSLYKNTARLIKKHGITHIHAHWIIAPGIVAAALKGKYKRKNKENNEEKKKNRGEKRRGKKGEDSSNHSSKKSPKKSFKLLITSHGGEIFGLKMFSWFKRWALRRSDHATAVSSAMRKEMLRVAPGAHIDVVPMGLDTTAFVPESKNEQTKLQAKAIRKQFGITKPFIIFVGRLSEKKGVRYLIEAMPAIAKKHPRVKALIVGGGELEKELQTLAKRLGVLDKNVIFAGPIANKELPAYYAAADFFVGPSIIAKDGDREGLPVTYMEAMAAGCAVVGTDLEGNKDIITTYKGKPTGVMIKQHSAEAIERTVTGLLDDKKRLRTLQAHARVFVQERFCWRVIAKKYERILK